MVDSIPRLDPRVEIKDVLDSIPRVVTRLQDEVQIRIAFSVRITTWPSLPFRGYVVLPSRFVCEDPLVLQIDVRQTFISRVERHDFQFPLLETLN